jgi:3-phosphoshikimate 1-carboxyvinyltransferase
MTSTEIRSIHPPSAINADIEVPPSKSYTNRALITAALANGRSKIRNPSKSDDTRYLKSALIQFGVKIIENNDVIEIAGTNGIIQPPAEKLYVGNAGTTMRFLASFSALASGATILTGDARMNKRPMKDLLDALTLAGIECTSNQGFAPLIIHGGKYHGGIINVNCEESSQFLSSLLLIAPYAPDPIIFRIVGEISSAPYIDMTIKTMQSFGAVITRPSADTFIIDNKQRYEGTEYTIEGDASSAGYFCAAAAITGGRIRITNLGYSTLQGDVKFIDILSSMGCIVEKNTDWIEVRGGNLHGIEIDMKEIPDSVPSLAVTSAFAEGETVIKNIRNLRYKESDRISAIALGLSRIGCDVETGDDWIKIKPNKLHEAEVNTFNDHRIAMSFAIAGLKLDNITIENPGSVTKSYPNFWEEIKRLEGR